MEYGRIYVASLSDYNAGYLHGEWVDVSSDAEEMTGAVLAMLRRSLTRGAEEWAIHDHDGVPFDVDEHMTFGEIAERVEAMERAESDGIPPDAYAAYIEHVGGDWSDVDQVRDAYNGRWSDTQEYAYDLAESCGEIPREGMLASYVDWEKFARDLFMCDYFETDAPGGGIYVWRNV